jgi:hypothetical protein
MIITAETACGRTVKSPQKDVRIYPWGEGVVCCDACTSVVDTRWSWFEVYA